MVLLMCTLLAPLSTAEEPSEPAREGDTQPDPQQCRAVQSNGMNGAPTEWYTVDPDGCIRRAIYYIVPPALRLV